MADSNQVKNVSVFIQDGAKDGDGTANLTDMNALINAGIKMGTDNSISLDSTQWEKTGEHTFSNATQDLTITTVNNVTADMTAEKNEFILKNS